MITLMVEVSMATVVAVEVVVIIDVVVWHQWGGGGSFGREHGSGGIMVASVLMVAVTVTVAVLVVAVAVLVVMKLR